MECDFLKKKKQQDEYLGPILSLTPPFFSLDGSPSVFDCAKEPSQMRDTRAQIDLRTQIPDAQLACPHAVQVHERCVE
jgi:hypothetical protein